MPTESTPDNRPTPPDDHNGRRATTQRRSAIGLLAIGLLALSAGIFVPTQAGADMVGPGSTVTLGNTPYTPSGGCDPSRDGWHLILNGIKTSDGKPPTAADFGPVTLNFVGGSTGSALFTDASGDKVGHFLDPMTNQDPKFTISSGSMVLPAGSRVIGYNNFVVSHGPCGNGTTTTSSIVTTTSESTTTTEPVTTTSESTTTTEPVTTTSESTTTTEPVTTTSESTTTTTPVSTETTTPTTSTPTTPTTFTQPVETIFIERQVQAATITPASGTLPSTGLDGRPFFVACLVLIACGGGLWLAARRRASA